MFFVQSIPCCADLVCQLPQTWVVVWLDDIIVPFEFRQIERFLDHLGILIKAGSMLFEMAQIRFLNQLVTTFSLCINVLESFNKASQLEKELVSRTLLEIRRHYLENCLINPNDILKRSC
jgi:hypothetical protein